MILAKSYCQILLWVDFLKLFLAARIHAVHHYLGCWEEEVMEDVIDQCSPYKNKNNPVQIVNQTNPVQ